MGQYNFEQIFFWSFHSELFRDGQMNSLLIFPMNFVFLIFHDPFIFQKQSFGGTLWKRCSFKNFAKFPWKRLYQSLFFNKASFLIESLLLKKSLFHRCFPVNFVVFFYRTPLVAASDLPLITEYNIYFSMFFYKLLFLRHLLYFLIKKYQI